MSDPITFYKLDQSQIELRICPRKTVMGRINAGLIGLGGIAMTAFSWGFFPKENFLYPIIILWGLTIFLLLRLIVTDDLVTLSREGLTYRRKGFFTKKSFFDLSSIEGFEKHWKHSGNFGYETVLIHLKDRKPVEIANTWFLPKEDLQVFVAEGKKFLNRVKSAAAEPDSAKKKAVEGSMRVVHLKKNRQFFVEQPAGSRWTRDEECSEFAIFRKREFSLKDFLVMLFVSIVWNGLILSFLLIWFGVIPANGKPPASLWWFVLVFTIPFGIMGVKYFLWMLGELFAGWIQEKWTFTRDEIGYEEKLFGIRRVYRFDVSRAEKLEIEPDGLFFVAGRKKDKETLCEIPLEFRAEGCWLASVFNQIYKS